MKKKSKYGRNPKLNPKTHCVMVRFDDEEWNKFLWAGYSDVQKSIAGVAP